MDIKYIVYDDILKIKKCGIESQLTVRYTWQQNKIAKKNK